MDHIDKKVAAFIQEDNMLKKNINSVGCYNVHANMQSNSKDFKHNTAIK